MEVTTSLTTSVSTIGTSCIKRRHSLGKICTAMIIATSLVYPLPCRETIQGWRWVPTRSSRSESTRPYLACERFRVNTTRGRLRRVSSNPLMRVGLPPQDCYFDRQKYIGIPSRSTAGELPVHIAIFKTRRTCCSCLRYPDPCPSGW
jgi:hypothetical protein